MPDGSTVIKQGEKTPIYGSDSVTGVATLTINGTPTCTLRDSSNAIVSGVNGVNVTANDVGAAAAPRAWYNLDSSALALIPGDYELAFVISVTGSDGIARVVKPNVRVTVIAEWQ